MHQINFVLWSVNNKKNILWKNKIFTFKNSNKVTIKQSQKVRKMVNWNAAAIALIGFFCVSGNNDSIIMKITKEHWEFQCMLNMTKSKYDSSLSIEIGGLYINLDASINMDAPCPSQFFRLNGYMHFKQFDIVLSLFRWIKSQISVWISYTYATKWLKMAKNDQFLSLWKKNWMKTDTTAKWIDIEAQTSNEWLFWFQKKNLQK